MFGCLFVGWLLYLMAELRRLRDVDGNMILSGLFKHVDMLYFKIQFQHLFGGI